MVSIEYSEAISEVLNILEHTKKEDVNKISPSFMKFLKENASKEYKPALDHNKRIKDMHLKEKTIGILSVINSQFWCTDKEKIEFENKLKENELKYQTELMKKYNPDNIFKNKNQNINKMHTDNQLENLPIVKYKKPIFIIVIDKIKTFFQ